MPGLTPIQSDIQAVCRAVTGTTGTYNEDLSAYLTAAGVSAAATATLDEKITAYAALYGSSSPTNSEGWQRLLDLIPVMGGDLRAPAQNQPMPSMTAGLFHSRTTNATMFDSAGRLVFAPANLQVNSAIPSSWSPAVSVTPTYDIPDPFGTRTAVSYIETGATNNHYVRPAALSPAVAGATYTGSIHVKGGGRRYFQLRMTLSTGGAGAIKTVLDTLTGSVTTGVQSGTDLVLVGGQATRLADGWWRVSVTGRIVAGSTLQIGLFNQADVSNDFYAGDSTLAANFAAGPQLELTSYSSPLPYIPTNFAISFYGPRFDYDPATLTPIGLLLEETRTNSLLWSNNLTNWTTKTDSTPVQDAVGIDGQANSAWTVTEGVAGTALMVGQCAASGILPTTGSIFLKRGNTDWVRVCVSDSTLTNGYYVWVNLNTGALGSTAALGLGTSPLATIRSIGNGWYRVSIKCVPDATSTTMALSVNTASADASGIRVTNGTYLACAAQVEGFSTSFTGPTSFIQTTGAAATRSADSLSGTWSDGISSLTLFVSVRQAVGVYGGLLTLRTDSNNSLMLYSGGNDVYEMYTGGVSQFNRNLPLVVPWALRKLIGSHTPAQQRVAANGGAVSTFASASSAPTVTQIQVGTDRFGSTPPNGWIQRFVVWNHSNFPDAVLSTLSGMT